MGWLDLTSAGPELDESCTAECTPITIATCLSAGTAIPYSKYKLSTTAIMAVSQHNISANHYIQYPFLSTVYQFGLSTVRNQLHVANGFLLENHKYKH